MNSEKYKCLHSKRELPACLSLREFDISVPITPGVGDVLNVQSSPKPA
jgi:hypothetical protein